MNSLKRAIQSALTTALIVGSPFSGGAVWAEQQQQQPSVVPKVIRRSGGVLQASATRRVQPEYPLLAKAAHVTGAVVVELTIDESGAVISAKAISGHPLLKDAAVNAALQWKFPPTVLSGVPVKVIGTITFNFAMGTDSGADSIEALEKETRDHPDSAPAYYRLAVTYYQHDRLTEAIQALRDAVRVDPNFGSAYVTLGEYLLHLGPSGEPEAIVALKEAARIDPHNAKAHLDLGIAYTKQGRYEEALGSFKQSIKDDPSAPSSYSCMAMTFTLMGKYEDAVDAYKEAIKRRSDDGSPMLYYDYVGLAAMYSKLDRTKEEIGVLKEAIALRPRIPTAHLGLGMAYLNMGDKKAARDEYNILKGLDPGMAAELEEQITKAPDR